MDMSTKTWAIRPFEPAKEDRAAWLRYHAYRRLRHAEFDPEEPLYPDEQSEEQLRRPWHTEISHRYAVELDGMVIGWARAGFSKPGSPEYESNKHLAWGNVAVCGPFRRQGVAREALRCIHADMLEHGAKVLNLYASDTEPDGSAWAEHIGATCKQTERQSRLYFKDVDWDEMKRWEEELPEKAPGYRIEIWPDRVPEESFAEYAPARSEMMNLMPWDDLEHGEIVITEDDLRQQNDRLSIDNSEHHTVLVRNAEGKIVGITDTRWYPAAPKQVDQWFTGVHPDARGLGVGKAVKAAMLRHLRDRYDPEHIGTENSQSNDAMLGINIRMGFKPHREWFAYQITAEEIGQYLERAGGKG